MFFSQLGVILCLKTTNKSGHVKRSKPKTQDQLKSWLIKKLRMENNPERFERLWYYLKKDREVSEWEQGFIGLEEVLEAAREQLDRADDLADYASPNRRRASQGRDSQGQDGQSQAQHVEVELTERDKATAEALEVYCAAQAANLPEVHRYRRENLPDGRLLVGEEEVLGFLAAQSSVKRITAGFGPKELRELGIDCESLALLALDHRYARYDSDESLDDEIRAARSKGKGMSFDEVVGLLVRTYPWRPGDAALFLLTGERPEVETLAAEVFARGTIAVRALYWVSEESVMQVLRRSRSLAAPGRPGRPLYGKRLEIFQFVAEQTEKEGKRPSWETLRRRWNEAHSDNKFESRNGFRNTYTRAEATVAHGQSEIGAHT